MIVPRGSSGLNRYKNRALLVGFRAVAQRRSTYERRDAVLTWLAPVAAEIDAVPAPWSGPRRRALPTIAPDQQPNRSPDRPQGGSA